MTGLVFSRRERVGCTVEALQRRFGSLVDGRCRHLEMTPATLPPELQVAGGTLA